MDPFPANTVSDEADGFPEADQQDQDDSRLGPLPKKRKKSQPESPVAKRSFEHWDSSSSESELEDFYDATLLTASNLTKETTNKDVKNFFSNAVKAFTVDEEDYDGAIIKVRKILFASLQDTKEAIKKNGELLNGRPIRLARVPNQRKVLLVRGFDNDLSEELIKEQLKTFFESCGVMKKIFIPKDDTGRCLSFGYIYMRQIDNKAEEKDSESMGGRVIKVTDVTSNVRFRDIKAEMEEDGWESNGWKSSEESEDGAFEDSEDGAFEDSEDDNSVEREPEDGEEGEAEEVDSEEVDSEGD